jgi:hypothetical protein
MTNVIERKFAGKEGYPVPAWSAMEMEKDIWRIMKNEKKRGQGSPSLPVNLWKLNCRY